MKLKFVLTFLLALIFQSCNAKTGTIEKSTEESALHYLVKEPKIKSGKAIILLHGVGSNEQDLFGLASQFPEDYYIICPRGKFTLSKESYAWYEINYTNGKKDYNKTQEIESRAAIEAFVAEMKEKYDLNEVYLGGFSQGSIMSFTLGLQYPEQFSGIICLSGRILDEVKEGVAKADELKKLNIFLAHGTDDATITIEYARQAREYLQNLGVNLSYNEYKMGHHLIPEELTELNNWLKNN